MFTSGWRGCRSGRMPCEGCAVQFRVFRLKRLCFECARFYCASCIRRGGGSMCAPCRALCTRPLSRPQIAHLRVRDLRCFLHQQNISTRDCIEKEELLSLCIAHVNSPEYRRVDRPFSSISNSIKGITNNFNNFIHSAFDTRTPNSSNASPDAANCYNAAHSHNQPPSPQSPQSPHDAPLRHDRFTINPGGEPEINVSPPSANMSRSASAGSTRVESADCFEVEDIVDAGWEFIPRPADPLPNDSEVLLSAEAPLTRAASEIELPRSSSSAPDAVSLQDESFGEQGTPVRDLGSKSQVTLDTIQNADELETLSVKQLKELLSRNNVLYRGALERADLVERARTLWNEHAKYKDKLESLPLEECCKICMSAPLECVLLECGHIATCSACAAVLHECPICRRYVARVVRCFKS